MAKKDFAEALCNILNKYNGLQHQVCSFHVDEIREMLTEFEKIGVPKDEREAYPPIQILLGWLYWRYQFSLSNQATPEESQQSFLDYWKPMPQEAYEILELFLPHININAYSPNDVFQSLLIEPVLHQDIAMLEYLWQQDIVQKHQKYLCQKELYHAALQDYCFLVLPDWREFKGNQLKILETVESKAKEAGVRPPQHLRWLLEHGFTDGKENLTLRNQYNREIHPGFFLHIKSDHYSPSHSVRHCWEIHTDLLNHEHQEPFELFHAGTRTGAWWPFTCSCGIPECADVYNPVLSVRFSDRIRWRVLTPKVLYCDFSIREYLANFKMAVKSTLYGMSLDGFSEENCDDEFQTDFAAEINCKRIFEKLLEQIEQEEQKLQ